MQARTISGYAAILALAWNPLSWVANAVGIVDVLRATMDPGFWVTRLLFWTHLDVVLSSVGLGLLAFLSRRPLSDRNVASELHHEADWAITHIRDLHVLDAAGEAQLHRDYGRWHQRVEDRIARFSKRFPAEYSAFMTPSDDFPVDVLTGITLEHSKLHSMVELKVSRLRSLIRTIQASGWFD